MSEEVKDQQIEAIKEAAIEDTKQKVQDPYTFLSTIHGAPSKAVLEDIKASTPNRQLKLFTPDAGKRVYIMRAIGALEFQKLQESMPANTSENRMEYELQVLIATTCCVWTNAGTAPNHKLCALDLKTGPAGLPITLYQLVSWLSDFVEPQTLVYLTADL